MMDKLLNLGVDTSLSNYLRDKVYIANGLSLYLLSVAIVYGVIGLFFGPPLIYPALASVICCVLTLIFNYQGKYIVSRMLIGINPSLLSAFYLAFVIQDGEPVVLGLNFASISFILFIFILVDFREPKLLFFLAIYSVSIVFAHEPILYWVDIPMDSQPFRHPIMQTLGYITGLGNTVFCLLFFLKQNYKTDQENENLMKELGTQRGEVLAQNEELRQQQEVLVTQQELIEHKNVELRAKNDFVKSSMNAAATIQKSVLPLDQEINYYFKQHFLVFKPKDVVSGDFYWLTKRADTTYLVVADCTGHSVAGAFMSLIGILLLDKIVVQEAIEEPALVLEVLHQEVKSVLRQNDTDNNLGMDAVVVKLRPTVKGTELLFSGAKNSLFYKAGKNQRLQELKGKRKSIGGYQNEAIKFETCQLLLPPNSMIYLGSDGIEDQNDAKRKKFGKKRLMQCLQENSHLSLEKQKKAIEQALTQHMDRTTQRDDILLMGIQL